jgi:MOSC domain-containing protein YiiM
VQTGIFKYPVKHAIHLGHTDVKNDQVIDRKHHGGIDKACYLYSANHYSFWNEKYPDLEWDFGMFGENITIEGFNESNVHVGDIFQIGTAKIQISQPRQPCYKLGIRFNTQKIIKDYINSPYPGTYARVIEAGDVIVEDEMKLIERSSIQLNLTDLFKLIYHGTHEDHHIIKELLDEDLIPADCKEALRKKYKP